MHYLNKNTAICHMCQNGNDTIFFVIISVVYCMCHEAMCQKRKTVNNIRHVSHVSRVSLKREND